MARLGTRAPYARAGRALHPLNQREKQKAHTGVLKRRIAEETISKPKVGRKFAPTATRWRPS